MLKSAVGHSNDPDSQAAVSEVLEQINCALAGLSPKAGILFAAIDFDHTLILHRIVEAFPGINLIGGTTDGEMSSVLGFEQDSLTLMVFCSEQITIAAGIGRGVSKDAIAASHCAVQQASAAHKEKIQLCISLPESLTTSGVLILESLKQALGKDVPIYGGLTADQWRSQQTYQFFQTEVCSDAVTLLLFSGPILFSHGIASGWQPIGKAGRVTKAKKNVVYEIDDQPALEFYQRYLGALPPSSEYPLALFDADSDRYYMRAPSGIYDPTIGSITFFGDVPVQSVVQITETTHNDILSASRLSTIQALENYPGRTPAAALFFSCASRRQILGSLTKQEYEQAQHCLTQPLPSCGFYTNGEIAPLQQKGVTHFHNETFITLLLGEA
ncbi:MAG: FIST C-terminal domain-containing protein [Chlorogloeopsis fritschii C42_A2020_084]|uniref:FIST signal transduction protein n=1 Tax=Chlorogloeopsis fritschii TaxID=1124 RepID=UPI0019E490D0|nr:FIST N-terminal domain-containing protein [Chlorogloeopsis fritschii]MBF2009356.1 FIST C-terminal domain-containing protein [Chlorogloeopsis fritschii C42_A2020_084]